MKYIELVLGIMFSFLLANKTYKKRISTGKKMGIAFLLLFSTARFFEDSQIHVSFDWWYVVYALAYLMLINVIWRINDYKHVLKLPNIIFTIVYIAAVAIYFSIIHPQFYPYTLFVYLFVGILFFTFYFSVLLSLNANKNKLAYRYFLPITVLINFIHCIKLFEIFAMKPDEKMYVQVASLICFLAVTIFSYIGIRKSFRHK